MAHCTSASGTPARCDSRPAGFFHGRQPPPRLIAPPQAGLGDRGHLIAWEEHAGRDGFGQLGGSLFPGWPGVGGVDVQYGRVAVFGERPAGAGKVTTAHQPRVQLVESLAVHLPCLQVPDGWLKGPLDEPLVGLSGGHVPMGDRSVLVQQFGHGRAGFRAPAVTGLLKKLAEFDFGLGLALDRGSEADWPLGERVGSAVHGDPV
jgi:hypothetical protein